MDSTPDNIKSLSEDVEALRALVLATFVERDAAVAERDTLLAQNDRLRHLLLKLTRMHFGARSERLPEEQLQLGLEALDGVVQTRVTVETPNPFVGAALSIFSVTRNEHFLNHACQRWFPAIRALRKTGPYPIRECRQKSPDRGGLQLICPPSETRNQLVA
jgi:hypothetical protein